MNEDGSIHFLNIEWLFRQIYDLFFTAHTSAVSTTNIILWVSHLWALVTTFAYLISFFFLGVLIYSTIRLYQTKEEEHHHFETLESHAAEDMVEHSRWTHVASLVESAHESDWRQAIIEADIMLDDILKSQGFVGETVGEKLKQANPQRFKTLPDAWEAHKVRNEIAHQGSAFQLSGQLAYRTIGHYKNVFEEFRAI